MSDPAWLAKFLAATAEARRQKAMDTYRLDSYCVQVARDIERERMVAVASNERYGDAPLVTGGL